MNRDPVTPALHYAVVYRDAKRVLAVRSLETFEPVCVAPLLDAECGPCSGRTTLDHVKDQPRLGKRAPSDEAHLVSICWHHHLDGWATSHRPQLREYLRSVAA